MRMETGFHMVKGGGETSYNKNSRLQQKALYETKQVVEKAVAAVCSSAALPRSSSSLVVVCDLGCGSSAKNTLAFLSEVINAAREYWRPVEMQFFLNDLPSNDFNHIFQSLGQLVKNSAAAAADHHNGQVTRLLPPFYIAGVPGSYYARLFPSQTVHLFHSSFSLHWHSQFPHGLEGNEGNIYIARTTPQSVVKIYQEQFQKDLMLFLELRCEELAFGGQMVLTFIGRKNEDVYCDDTNCLYELLAQSLQSLVEKDLVTREQLNSFNLPIYGASIGEVKEVVNRSGLFGINNIRMFHLNWDPYNDSHNMHDSIKSGMNTAKCIRAVMETLFANHFGESIIDALFEDFANKVAGYLQREGSNKYSVIVLSLHKK